MDHKKEKEYIYKIKLPNLILFETDMWLCIGRKLKEKKMKE